MWIAIDGAPHKTFVDAAKLDTICVMRVGYGDYKVVGRLGDRDMALRLRIPTESEAQEWIDELVRNLMS